MNRPFPDKSSDNIGSKYFEASPIFKILCHDEILDYLHSKNIQIEKPQLINPNSGLVTEIFVTLLSSMKLVHRDVLNLNFEDHSKFNYPGLHDRQIFLMKLFYKMKPIFTKTLNVKDFQTSDLFSPSDTRTNFFLSGLISLHKTYDKISIKISKLNSTTNETNEMILKLNRDLENAEDEKNLLMGKYEIEKPKADQKSNEIMERNAQIREKSNIIEAKEKQLKLIRDELNQTCDRIKKVQEAIIAGEKRTEVLNSKIVNSPNEVNDKINIQNSLLAGLSSILQEMTDFKNCLGKANSDLKETASMGDDMAKSINSHIDEVQTNESKVYTTRVTNEKLNAAQNELITVETSLQELRMDLSRLSASIEEEEKVYKSKLDELNNQISSSSITKKKEAASLDETIATFNSQSAELRRVEFKLKEAIEFEEATLNDYLMKIENVQNAIVEYSNSMQSLYNNSSKGL